MQGRVNAAVAQDSTGRALVGEFEVAVTECVTEGTVWNFTATGHVGDGIAHIQRIESSGFEESRKWNLGDFFDDQAEESITGVRIEELCSGREQEAWGGGDKV